MAREANKLDQLIGSVEGTKEDEMIAIHDMGEAIVGLYQVICNAEHTETGDNLIVYKYLREQSKIVADPVELFYSKLNNEDCTYVGSETTGGSIAQHFKGKLYKIICTAEHSQTEEKLVIYQALYDTFKIYARPEAMFNSKVDREKYPEVQQEYRFEVINAVG